MEKPCGALWGMVVKHLIPPGFKPQAEANSSWKGCVGHAWETREPQQDSSPRRCQKHTQRCFRNSIFGTTKGIQGNTLLKGWCMAVGMNRITRQSHRCWDEPEYRGKAVWRTVGHGSETPDPQQDSSPRRCQKRAHRCSRNSIFGTAKARQ